ncbi:MAG: hypothetical protein ABIH72_05255 [archaeon]
MDYKPEQVACLLEDYFHLRAEIKGLPKEELMQSKAYKQLLLIESYLKSLVLTGEEILNIGLEEIIEQEKAALQADSSLRVAIKKITSGKQGGIINEINQALKETQI